MLVKGRKLTDLSWDLKGKHMFRGVRSDLRPLPLQGDCSSDVLQHTMPN